MNWIEIVGTLSGLICVWLLIQRNIWNFPAGMLSAAMFLVLFTQSGLYADAGLQIVFIALNALGLFWWLRGGAENDGVQIASLSPLHFGFCLAAVAAIAVAIHFGLTRWTDSTVAGWDAITTALSLVAQFMLSRKWIANWWLWIAADLIYIPLYIHKDLWLTAGLYGVFLVMCIIGLREWQRAAKTDVPR
ncbi:MAG: nicotinamide riboside transporter PnuC [Pseudomonadota bacterium]